MVSVLQCEASYPINITGAGNPGEAESVSFFPTNNGSYTLFFAVAGADPVADISGQFDIQITVQ